ncbi:MAG: DUF1553 domain-containing protein [Verrucomicrobiales bacterium]|nr:DUF1553 domain-containing protein [Verrucomicrobiales bacterium]
MMKGATVFVLMISLMRLGSAVSFNDQIRPILADRCFACHGPDSAARKAGLRLDREEFAKAALAESGNVPIVAGHTDKSEIFKRITSNDPDEVMPPQDAKSELTAKEIQLIGEWITEGAKWERHWAFMSPQKRPFPGVNDKPWVINEIDYFILSKLESLGLKPSAATGKEQLLRRASLDLTGLPPTITDLENFVKDNSDNAFEDAVDRLLDSPGFGERMALEWLDVARYGDTDGLFEDHPRSIYPWRDWVISAFNTNLPYNDFITWQVSGDLIPDAANEQKLATGFLRNNPTSNEGGIIDEDYRIKYLVDRVNTTATAFLGLTMECAQCHDHKFDPISQREYYQFSGFFNSLVGRGNTKGATAPTLKILSQAHTEQIAKLADQIKGIESTLKGAPPELNQDFEKWLIELEKPIPWKDLKEVSDAREGSSAKKVQSKVQASKIMGRYLRVALPKGQKGFITISEVEVYSLGKNVGRLGKASQSSDYSAAGLASKAIDGNADGSFGSCSCTKEQEDAWWEIDLGSEMPIDHVVIFNRNDCCPERLDNVSVSLLDSSRKQVTQRKIGDALFRSVLTFNPGSVLPESGKKNYELIFESVPGPLAAISLSGLSPGIIESVRIERVSSAGNAHELKIVGEAKGKFSKENPLIIGLEKPENLTDRDRLKVSLVGDNIRVSITDSSSAVERKKVPEGRDKRLAYFRESWSGFKEQRSTLAAAKKSKSDLEGKAEVSMIAADEAKSRATHVLMRGEYDKPGERVEPAAPSSIMTFSPDLPKNRSGLARWITDPENPLAARVAVNRYWQMIFGNGIVKTSEDLGTQGQRPSHRLLLDYLAIDFVESGWDVKRLIRKIVTSATYRQSSKVTRDIVEMDPENELLSHAPRRRLEAEFIRDHALSVSGLLVNKIGGPGVNPYQPSVLFGRNAIGASNVSFTQSKGESLYRRSLYTYWKRQIPAANMRILGADGRNSCRTRRERTNTPLQALVLLNDPQFVEAARAFAERTIREGGESVENRIAFAFRLATSRKVTGKELRILLAEYSDRLAEFQSNKESAKAYLSGGGVREAPADIESAELAATAAVMSLILNLDESISKS